MGSNSAIQGYNIYPMLHFCRKFSSGVTVEADAINALEGTFYYQEGQTVDNYLDSFQALVSNAGYMDPQILVVKF